MRQPKPKSKTEALNREDVEIDTAALLANPRNPRKHDDEQITGLAASLRRDGQTKPLLVRRENRMIIAGHGIHQAAQMVGLERLHVVLLDVDQKAADRIMLGDNRHSDRSTSDNARVTELLREIDQADWLATGYSDNEAEKLFAKIEAADLVVHEIEASDRQDTFWISVYGPLAEQAVALQRLKELYKEMPKITVMLGTTPDLR
jgi:ParB-like chromosome segregation protein Spo0J